MTYLYIYKNEKKKSEKNYIFHWTSNNSSILSWWGWKLNCGLILNSSVCSLPSEIVGDISYEELRAAAYDDNRRGVSLQSIVRNLTYHIWLFCNCMLRNILRMTYQKKKHSQNVNFYICWINENSPCACFFQLHSNFYLILSDGDMLSLLSYWNLGSWEYISSAFPFYYTVKFTKISLVFYFCEVKKWRTLPCFFFVNIS